jgi:hypothetical protein
MEPQHSRPFQTIPNQDLQDISRSLLFSAFGTFGAKCSRLDDEG